MIFRLCIVDKTDEEAFFGRAEIKNVLKEVIIQILVERKNGFRILVNNFSTVHV